jgi:OmpA-OmpF porin, OOP family
MGVTLGVFLGGSTKMVGKDKDGDGVADKTDQCPDLKGAIALLGCPDGDSDGIPDKDDKCASVWGPAENNGCPYQDKDGDGVLDKDDKCPTVAGTKENGGCAGDSDKDGIPDNVDKCPNVAGLQRYSGCPIPDTDGDGLNDELDKCPNVKGVKENNGCPEVKPEIKQEIVEKVNYAAKRIQFKFAQAEISPESFKTLNEVVTILRDNPELKLSIEGHTSGDGIYDQNMKLSSARAEKVKEYLISKGISATRLTAMGYGPTKLLNSGKTEAEKAQNRRVELKLSN